MKKLLPLYTSLLIILLNSFQAEACRCLFDENVDTVIQQGFRGSQLVILGDIIEVDGENWLLVKEVFKGDLQVGDSIKTGSEQHSCAFSFHRTGAILVYGQLTENVLYTQLCTPSKYLTAGLPTDLENKEPNPSLEREKLIHELEKLREMSL